MTSNDRVETGRKEKSLFFQGILILSLLSTQRRSPLGDLNSLDRVENAKEKKKKTCQVWVSNPRLSNTSLSFYHQSNEPLVTERSKWREWFFTKGEWIQLLQFGFAYCRCEPLVFHDSTFSLFFAWFHDKLGSVFFPAKYMKQNLMKFFFFTLFQIWRFEGLNTACF